MTTLFVAAHDEKTKQTKKNLLSNNREKGMRKGISTLPTACSPQPYKKKKRETVYCRLLTPTTVGYSPYYLIFRT